MASAGGAGSGEQSREQPAGKEAAAAAAQYAAMEASDRSAFDGWVRAFKRFTGVGLTAEEARMRRLEDEFKKDVADCRRCEKWRNELLKTSPRVRFMAEHLRSSGIGELVDNMPCIKCDEERSGGFMPPAEIQLCYNQLFWRGHLESTMVHEMVHAYDHTNFNVDWDNLEHRACAEIRAASLSGDCSWFQEMMRGRAGFLKHHQACVKRRAALSLMLSTDCDSQKRADAAVNKVFQSCFTDTRPFDEIY